MTNAAKYGALSVASGRVAISWQVKSGDGGRALHVRWEEHGGPPVARPVHMGFGRMLLERSLAYDIEGEGTLDFRAEGLACEAFIPFEHIIELEGEDVVRGRSK